MVARNCAVCGKSHQVQASPTIQAREARAALGELWALLNEASPESIEPRFRETLLAKIEKVMK